jgi:predicted RNA-binding protein with PUA-like domain
MAFWLLKTEPSVYSYDDLVRDGKTVWDGVTNPVALKNIRSMKKGDLVFIYHTGNEKQIIGIAEVVSDPVPDPSKRNPKLTVVEVKAKKKIRRPVTLAEVKSRREFAKFELVRLPRLSVMPVDEAKWNAILRMAE